MRLRQLQGGGVGLFRCMVEVEQRACCLRRLRASGSSVTASTKRNESKKFFEKRLRDFKKFEKNGTDEQTGRSSAYILPAPYDCPCPVKHLAAACSGDDGVDPFIPRHTRVTCLCNTCANTRALSQMPAIHMHAHVQATRRAAHSSASSCNKKAAQQQPC